MFDIVRKILISEKEFTKTNYKRLEKLLVYTKNNSIDSHGNMYLSFDSSTEINNAVTG